MGKGHGIHQNGLSERYSLLAYKVLHAMRSSGKENFTVGVTSHGSGEGVSSIAIRLAETLGDINNKVLLVDVKPNQLLQSGMLAENSQDTESERTDGSLDLPESKVTPMNSQMLRTERNVDVILAREQYETNGSCFNLSLFNAFLEKARERYDMVIVDCPPAAKNSVTMLISSKVDAVVLVVEAGKVRRESLQRNIADLRAMGAKILGVVLNKRRYPIPEFIYRMI